MGLIGNEIIQSRVWIDPSPKPEPKLNYKYTFPITVFDAVRQDMLDPDSPTLSDVLERIRVELDNRQNKIPGLPANHLVTYAGVPGAVGSIQISQKIPWDPVEQRHDRIPTERAVGEMMYKLGLTDQDGNIIDPEERRYVWTDIIGRPNVYYDLGDNDDGFMTQRAVTEQIESLKRSVESLSGVNGDHFESLLNDFRTHISDDNPHHITAEKIGAPSREEFDSHISADNPHGITPEMIGLGNVDNTSDEDKPISRATQEALDVMNALIKSIQEAALGGIDISGLKYFTDAKYDQSTGNLMLTYNNGSRINVYIPTNDLVADIRYDEETQRIVFTRLNGSKRYLDLSNLSDLVIRYNGSEGNNIVITVDSIEGSSDKVIKASIVPGSITREMLADDAITADLIPARSITADKLFRGKRDYTVLATMAAGEDPRWSRIVGNMIEDDSILTRHIADSVIATSKLQDLAVTTEKLQNASVTEEKLADGSVTNDKVADGSISGSKLVWDPQFIGTPRITKSPSEDSDGSEVPDTSWVRKRIDERIIDRNHLADESVGPSKLFRATEHNMVLISPRYTADPKWGKINHEMILDDIIHTSNIRDLAVTPEKIADEAIQSRHLTRDLISEYNLQEGSVTSEKIWASHSPNMILGVHNAEDHPMYTKVNEEMLEENVIGTSKIKDRSVTLSKLETSRENNRVLAVGLRNSTPVWSQITGKMIEDRAIQPKHFFTSDQGNMILAVLEEGADPQWVKIVSEMIADDSIGIQHIKDGSITGEKIVADSIGSDHLQERSILPKHIGNRIIRPYHLFSSSVPDTVLAVKDEMNTDPIWTKITGNMIEDLAITPEKIYPSKDPYRVLGVKDPNTSPEYLSITGDFIEDGSIGSSKLAADLVLRGNPTLSNHPAYVSDGYAIPTTQWVRRIINDALERFDGVTTEIPENALFPGSPRIDTRPPANASDVNFNGNLIPDCQWVLDRIKEWYDKIIEMEPDVPEDIWGDTIPTPGGGGSGAIGCGPCVLQELTGIEVENTWDNGGAEPDVKPPEDPWDAHCMMKEISAATVDRIWETGKTTEELQPVINWPNFRASTSTGVLSIEVAEDYDGPGFAIHSGKLTATGDENVVSKLKIVNGKLVYVTDAEEPVAQAMFSVNAEDRSLSVETPDGYDGPEFALKNGDLIASGEADVIERLSITNDQLLLADQSPVESTSQARFSIDASDRSLEAELPEGYNGPNFSMVDGNLYAEGQESVISKLSIENDSLMLDASSEHVCRCDIEEVTEEWVKEVWDDEITNPGGGNCSCPGDCTGCVQNGSITALKLAMGAVTTSKIAERAVTGSKLFTSGWDNTVLGVREAGTDPVYLKITREMLDDSRIIDGSKLFSTYDPNRVLAVTTSGGDPQWVKIRNEFLDDNIIQTRNLADESVTGRKIQDKSIGVNKLAEEPMIYPVHLTDRSVTTKKIDFEAVRNEHIKDGSITGKKIAKDIVIPAYPTVETHTDYERRSLRNTILSPNAPKGGQNGDIWFRYI